MKIISKNPPYVIRIMVCPADRLTMMLFKDRRDPKKDRKKIGKRLIVEKITRTKSVNVEMIFKKKSSLEISIIKMPNAPEVKKPLEISTVEVSNVPKMKNPSRNINY